MRLSRAHTPPTPRAKRPQPTLPEGEREHLKAEVVYWGLKQAQQGRLLSEAELQAEYDRRLREAEHWLRQSKDLLQQEYDRRLHDAEQWLRERKEQREQREEHQAPHASAPGAAPASSPSRILTRRNVLKVLGLSATQVAAAVAAVKLSGNPAPASADQGPPPVDGSDEPDVTKIDHVKLAAENAGHSLYGKFPGATKNPYPNHLELLFPKAAEPAKAGRVREFSLEAQDKELEIANGVRWAGWTYNGTIPGPVIRATQGDTVRVHLKNSTRHTHSVHFHSVHPSNQDGVFEPVAPGAETTYEFTADPFGVHPYHCHIEPLDQHVARGLYGALIIDPPKPRPPAREMVMVMQGYDLNFDKENELYSVNGLPGYYDENPIELKVGELVRIYLINMTEFDPVNSFHLHANMFSYIPVGTSLTPNVLTDVVHLGIADRGILEFRYKFPGQYMFHAHQTELSLLGWKAQFHVT